MRTSQYVIYVNLAERDDVLLVHGYTGAYDKVSRQVAAYLQSLQVEALPKPLHGEWSVSPAPPGVARDVSTPSDSVLARLEKRGYLTAMSTREEEAFFAKWVSRLHKQNAEAAPRYVIMPTYDCNLRCSYCFQNHMRTNSQFNHLLRPMSMQIVDRIIDAFPAIEREYHDIHPGDLARRSIGLFGGEPLLAAHRSIVEYIMNKAGASGPTTFWAVTNGTELPAYEDLLGPSQIGMVQITLDGSATEHDRRRVHVDGAGSFAEIARGIDCCLDRDVEVSIRLNVDRLNISTVPVLADEIISRGWDQCSRFGVYAAGVYVYPEPGVTAGELVKRRADTFTSTWELDEALEALRGQHACMRVISKPDTMMKQRARRVFDRRSSGIEELRTSHCGAHSNMYIFDPFGDVYACWDRTGDSRIRVGKLLDDGGLDMDEAVRKMWRARTVASNPICRKCRYAMHCGGGCAVAAESKGGNFFSNHCDDFGVRFQSSVAGAYEDFVAGANATFVEGRVCE